MYLHTHPQHNHIPWNKGKLIAQKPLLKPKEIRAIHFRFKFTNHLETLLYSI